MLKYPSIPNIYTVVKEVRDIDLPAKVDIVGWEKIHGTNAAVCYTKETGLWVQSRTRIITVRSDNAGCAADVEKNKDHWVHCIEQLAAAHNIDLQTNVVALYYEWCGGNIQKKSALTGCDKTAMLFAHFAVYDIEVLAHSESTIEPRWLPTIVDNTPLSVPNKIYNIRDYPIVRHSVDMTDPIGMDELLMQDVVRVEGCSEVGKAFGKEANIGEGYVYTFTHNDRLYKFKVKGSEHAIHTRKPKQLRGVSSSEIQKLFDVVCPPWRLEQMFDKLQADIGVVTVKDTGAYIKAVKDDILKEEGAKLSTMGVADTVVLKSIGGLIALSFKDRLLRGD